MCTLKTTTRGILLIASGDTWEDTRASFDLGSDRSDAHTRSVRMSSVLAHVHIWSRALRTMHALRRRQRPAATARPWCKRILDMSDEMDFDDGDGDDEYAGHV